MEHASNINDSIQTSIELLFLICHIFRAWLGTGPLGQVSIHTMVTPRGQTPATGAQTA